MRAVDAVMTHPVNGRGRGNARAEMQPKSSKRIHTTHRQWSYTSYWKVPRATFAADYSPASIALAEGFVLQPFCDGHGEHEILPAGTATSTCRMIAGRLPIGITAVSYAGWF